MIDFRYHVVSLVAVFIALAVGIVLGAGPLREGISDTLEGEVAQLRSERADLRAELDAAQSRALDKDAALGTVTDRVVAGTLAGARVAVVLLPDSDRNPSARLREGVEAAGGEVVLTVEVDADLEALEGPDGRAALVETLGAQLETGEPGDRGDEGAPDDQGPGLGRVLAAALLGADGPGATGAWLGALDRLDSEGYVDLAWRGAAQSSVLDRRPPDVLLVVDGPLATEPDGQLTRPAGAALQERTALVERLAEAEAAVVVAGAGTEVAALTDTGGVSPLVGVVRDERRLRDEVSTVDNLESAAGRLAAVLALGWELDGQSGSYGQGPAVEAPVPAPAPVRVGTPPVVPPDDSQTTAPVPEPQPEGPATTSVPDDASATTGP